MPASAANDLGVHLAGALETALPPALLARVAELFREEQHVEALQAEIANQRMQQLNRRRHRAIDGVGEVVARINPTSFHFWGTKLGYECWSDRTFLREYLRDVPEARVRSAGTKLQVGYAAEAPKRVTVKRYPANP